MSQSHVLTDCHVGGSIVAGKRAVDISLALLGLIAAVPIILVLGILIKVQSPGPVVYSQKRVGLHRKPFRMYKLRSMVTDAEADGPQLSYPGDVRVIPVGRFMRKYHLDEIPNLWNVLAGDMSIVGPRPEREYFIDKIETRAPEYEKLLRIKPGLTSWGMVKYGYAYDVDGMISRMKYDMIYLDEMSMWFDIKIMCHTVLTVMRGEGK
ncbi:MAG: sugar transferase [Paenibacillus sp.]|nr:sugar transferase [Paenibacillus sp.]